MANAKFVKTAAAVALGTSVVATAVAPSASAATTYKIKSGKLVNAETGKVIKGYKTYKSVLYKDGKKYTGTRSGKYYKNGVLSSGVYNNIKYKKGIKFTGLSTSDNKMYKNGKLLTGTKDGVKYKAGVKFTGVSTNGKYYKNGVLGTGTYKNVKYKNGVEFTGVSTNGKYYENGVVATGVKTVDNVVYVDGVKDEVAPEITAEDTTVEYGSTVDVATLATVKDNSGEEIKATAVITFDGKEVPAIDTKVAGKYTVAYAAKDVNGNEAKKEITVTVAAPAKAAVESVEATNAATVVVKFNKAVSKEEAVKAGVVSIEGVAFDAAKTTLSEDGKTLTLVANSPINVTNAKLVVKSVVTAEDAKEKTEEYVSLFTFKDTVAPTVVSATAAIQKVTDTTTNKVVVKFSEPVKPTALAYVNGTNVAVSQDAEHTDELVLTLGTAVKAGDALEIKLTNVKDLADNTIAPNPATVSTTVQAADTVAPVVTNVSTKGLTVTFSYDKEVTPAADASKTYVSANGTQVGTLTAPEVSKDQKSVTYKVTLNDTAKAAYDKDGVYAGTLYVQEGLVSDKAGNKSVATTQSVTFAADKVAPTLVSSEYKEGKLVLNFDEAVKVDADTKVMYAEYNATTGFTGTTNTKTVTSSDLSNDGKTVTVNLEVTADADKDKTYKVSYAEGAFKDADGNKAAALNSTITVPKLVASEANDTKAPTVNEATTSTEQAKVYDITVKEDGDNYKIVYNVTDQADATKGEKASGLDFATILNTGNYTLDGKALPEGTTIATDAKTDKEAKAEVTITIPKTSVKANINGPLTITGIKDAKGNTLTEIITSANLKLSEGVAPELKTATLVNNTIVLGYSEELEAAKAEDLEVKVNGKVLKSSHLTIAEGTGTDQGKYILTVKPLVKDAVTEVKEVKPVAEKEAGFYAADATTPYEPKVGDKIVVGETTYTYAAKVDANEETSTVEKAAGFYAADATTPYEPKVGDKIVVGETTYTYAAKVDEVKEVKPVAPQAAYDYILLEDGDKEVELKLTDVLSKATEVTSVTVGTKKSDSALVTKDKVGNTLVQGTVITVK